MKPKLFTLPNGLTVVLEENHAAPVLSFNALVKVGSADETDSEAGISHLIEHMLFKGTPSRKVGEIARDVEAAGGDINAYTSFDQTVYYINMSKRFADQGLDILADAVCHPTFDAAELEREKEVVLEEIRRERDNPPRWLGEILFQKAYHHHTYGRPIIGFEKTVRAISRNHLFEYYHQWYHPQNVVVVVVGDFKTEEMLRKVEKIFGPWTGGERPRTMDHGPWTKNTRPPEPPHLKPVLEIHSDNIQSLHLALAFNIPQITHPDVPALDILSHILGGAESSRLEQILKEKKRLVQSIYAYAYTPRDPGLFILGGNMNPPQTSKAFSSLWEEIEKMKDKGPTAEELKNAKLNIRSNEIYEKETVGGQAGKIAYFLATAGQLDFEEKYYDKIQTITAKEIAEATQRYLTFATMTTALLVPKKDCTPSWKGKMTQALLAPPTKKIPQKSLETKQVTRWTLPNGVRLILKENHSLPIVSIHSASLGGLLAENKTDNGINHLLAQCITKGTKKRTALEVAQSIESIAGQISGFSGKNSSGLSATFLSDYTKEGLDLFFECLLEPIWDPKEIEKEKKQTLEAIKNQEDALSTLAFLHFQKTLFPHHPYGMRTLGQKNSVSSLTPQKLKAYYQKMLVGKNRVISLVGDFSTDEVLPFLKTKLGTLESKTHTFKKPGPEQKLSTIKKVVTRKAKEQAHVVLGFFGSTVTSPDHAPLAVLNSILSGMGGRLFLELRDKLSLAYSISCVLQEGVDPGYFAVYMGTEPSKVPTALKGIEKELKKIATELVTKEELQRTQNYLAGTYELELQKNTTLAQSFAFNELYGLGFEEVYRYPEKILRVTREDVLKVAKKYIDLNAYVLSIVQP